MNAPERREQLEARIWRILGEYSHAPRVQHVEEILVWADIYALAHEADALEAEMETTS